MASIVITKPPSQSNREGIQEYHDILNIDYTGRLPALPVSERIRYTTKYSVQFKKTEIFSLHVVAISPTCGRNKKFVLEYCQIELTEAMPQNLPPLDPDDFPLDGESEGKYSFPDNFCEQLGLNYQDESHREKGDFYSEADITAGMKLLSILRDSGEPLTKKQLAVRLYPKVFSNNVKHWRDEYGRWWNITKQIQKQYIADVARQLRAINQQIYCTLDEILNQSDQMEYLKTVSLAIPISTDSMGRAKYVYQGPDAPKSPEVLEMFYAWAETHQAKNSRLLSLAKKICESSNNQSGSMLDPNDVPGLEEDQQLDLGFDFLQ